MKYWSTSTLSSTAGCAQACASSHQHLNQSVPWTLLLAASPPISAMITILGTTSCLSPVSRTTQNHFCGSLLISGQAWTPRIPQNQPTETMAASTVSVCIPIPPRSGFLLPPWTLSSHGLGPLLYDLRRCVQSMSVFRRPQVSMVAMLFSRLCRRTCQDEWATVIETMEATMAWRRLWTRPFGIFIMSWVLSA